MEIRVKEVTQKEVKVGAGVVLKLIAIVSAGPGEDTRVGSLV